MPIDGNFGQIVWDMNFKFVLPIIHINFDIQTKFEVNQTQIGHSIPKKLQKITKNLSPESTLIRSPPRFFTRSNSFCIISKRYCLWTWCRNKHHDVCRWHENLEAIGTSRWQFNTGLLEIKWNFIHLNVKFYWYQNSVLYL